MSLFAITCISFHDEFAAELEPGEAHTAARGGAAIPERLAAEAPLYTKDGLSRSIHRMLLPLVAAIAFPVDWAPEYRLLDDSLRWESSHARSRCALSRS